MAMLAKRTRQAALRRAVFARDRGVCQECGVDTVELLSAYRAAKAQVYGAWRVEVSGAAMVNAPTAVCIAISQRHKGQIIAIEDRLRRLGFTPGRSFWECHHSDGALAEGGPDTVEACVTLCIPCHKAETAALAARRARRPSKWIPRRAA